MPGDQQSLNGNVNAQGGHGGWGPDDGSSSPPTNKKHMAEGTEIGTPAINGPDSQGEPDAKDPTSSVQATFNGSYRSYSQDGNLRTTSQDRNDARLKHSDRHRADGAASHSQGFEAVDFSLIAVFSKESSAVHAMGYWKGVTPSTRDSLLSLSSRKAVAGNPNARARQQNVGIKRAREGTEEQVNALLDGRNLPHVIVALEGDTPEDSVSIGSTFDGKQVRTGYKKAPGIDGTNISGHKNRTQNFRVFIREDLYNSDPNIDKGYKSNSVTIEFDIKDENNNFVKHASFKCISITYKDVKGGKYETLVVHIPNDLTRSKNLEDQVHEAFVKYAADRYENDGIIVTGYLGDTNFHTSPISRFHRASYGGHFDADGKTLNPVGSGAGNTDFMRSVPLSQSDCSHATYQASTLNHVCINPATASDFTPTRKKEAVDHPSIMGVVGLKHPLDARNPDGNPDYYPKPAPEGSTFHPQHQ